MQPRNNKRGLIIRGRFVTWTAIIEHYVCRQCGQRVGLPHADPITGQIDHDRIVCSGLEEHEIKQEGDLKHQKLQVWYDQHQTLLAHEVAQNFNIEPVEKIDLYGDENFEGFD